VGHLAEHKRDLPAGTFVFIVSDFLEAPTRDEWLDALERRYELVPVIVQDTSETDAARVRDDLLRWFAEANRRQDPV
jgi:hypothetical protein